MVMASDPRHYNFGVEIESVVRPYGGNKTYSTVDWYRQLAEKLRHRGIAAAHDECTPSAHRGHDEYYGSKWFVTRDGSLERDSPPGVVCMEVVSPVLNTAQPVTQTIQDFWEAMSAHFDVQRNVLCGGHVHVTPSNGSKRFSLAELKIIAFAAVFYEDYVADMLPRARRNNPYCSANSQSISRHGSTCQLRVYLRAGAGGSGTSGPVAKTVDGLRMVADQIRLAASETQLARFMQADRYVLWNFANTHPDPRTGKCSGTIEFRGGSQFCNTTGTLSWVAFVVGFITLVLTENLLQNFRGYSPPTSDDITAFWQRVRQCAKRSSLSRYLPEDYKAMQRK